jgi:Protein of unknown function (DUF3433)
MRLLTYRPVFSIVSALWTLVEYRIKQLTPWQVLRQGPADATESVLLDYLSPWNVISLFRSLKAGHYVVTITILATLLIRLLIISSTGLLLLQDAVIQNTSARFFASDKFTNNQVNLSAVDSKSALTVAGIASFGLSFPMGTTETYTYQSFNVSNTTAVSYSTLTGAVEAFTADLECESANLQHYHRSDDKRYQAPCVKSTECAVQYGYLQLAASDCLTDVI